MTTCILENGGGMTGKRVPKTSSLWTTLPPLALRCDERGFYESFHHYTLRVLHACGIPQQRFWRWVQGDGPPRERGRRLGCSDLPAGFSPRLQLLKRLTGREDLHRGTFSHVADVLGTRGMTSHSQRGTPRRWCPQCYLEWDETTSFEPLAWAFTMLAACPTHNVLLCDTCAECGCEQRLQTDYGARRVCRSCLAPLTGGKIYADLKGVQAWVDQRLCNFVKFVHSLDDSVARSRFTEFICEMRDRTANGDRFPAGIRQLVLPAATRPYASRPSIFAYLNLCGFQGVEIEEMLLSPKEAASKQLFGWGEEFGRVHFNAFATGWNIVCIGLCLDALLEAPDTRLMPIGMFCRRFGLWVDVVRDHYPDTYGLYVERQAQQSGRFTYVHEARAFRCALHLLEAENVPVTSGRMRSLAAELANRARVSVELALQCAMGASALLCEEARCARESGNGSNRVWRS